MKTCFYCKRDITNSIKILNNGIKYICADDNDCKMILFPIQQIENKTTGVTKIICSCGHTFLSSFTPNYDSNCSKCGITHTRLPDESSSKQTPNVICSCGHTFFTDFPFLTCTIGM
jgi:hypothetical protein